jgi:hypothetical protein
MIKFAYMVNHVAGMSRRWPDSTTITKNFCPVLPEPIELSEAPLQAFAQWILHEARGLAS